MTDDFRCSVASRADDEALAGTAPTDAAMLLVEETGPWGAKAITDNRLPVEVRSWLAGLDGVRPQLVRRPGPRSGPGTRVFHAVAGADGFAVSTAVLDDVRELPEVDLTEGGDLEAHDDLLWLVCTNGRRDRCCAELGRPVAKALARRWPEQTWETTHLGGHRFSGTLLALPSGHTLGRLNPLNAVESCQEVVAGGVPLDLARGRAGRPAAEQVLELHVLGGGSPEAQVVAEPGPVRRQSCGDLKEKATTRWRVRD